MPSIDSLHALLVEELRDIYDAERQLTKAIPKLAKASTNEDLRDAFEQHLSETEQHVERLEQAFDELDESTKRKTCAGMKGLIQEGDEHAKEDYEEDGLRDAAIIGAAQRVEHYEMAAYGTAIAHARLLDHGEVVRLLEATLAEEKAADKKLTQIANTVVNQDAAHASASDEEEETGMPGMPGRQRRGMTGMTERSMAAAKSSRSPQHAKAQRRGKRSR